MNGTTTRTESRATDATTVGRRDGLSIGSLLKQLTTEGANLVRQEVQLAKAEMAEKARVFQRGAMLAGAGAALLLVAMILFFTAVNRALTVILDAFLGLELAVWIAPLVLTGILAIIGYSLLRKGQRAMKSEGIKPRQTTESLREDARWLKEMAKDGGRNGGRHHGQA